MTGSLKNLAYLLAVFISLAWPVAGSYSSACAAPDESRCCGLVADALGAANRLKAGMTRADIEKEFVHDGGLEFPDRATYTYRRCRYVKVDVEFQPRANDTISFSPDDQAAKISRPYLAYPVSD